MRRKQVRVTKRTRSARTESPRALVPAPAAREKTLRSAALTLEKIATTLA